MCQTCRESVHILMKYKKHHTINQWFSKWGLWGEGSGVPWYLHWRYLQTELIWDRVTRPSYVKMFSTVTERVVVLISAFLYSSIYANISDSCLNDETSGKRRLPQRVSGVGTQLGFDLLSIWWLGLSFSCVVRYAAWSTLMYLEKYNLNNLPSTHPTDLD